MLRRVAPILGADPLLAVAQESVEILALEAEAARLPNFAAGMRALPCPTHGRPISEPSEMLTR